MELSKVRAREEIIAKFHDGQIIAIGGQTGQYMPERLIQCVLDSGARHLTIYSIDTSDPGTGVGRLIRAGVVDRIITTHVGTNPETNAQIQAGTLRAEFSPMGSFIERIRCGGLGLGGVLTKTGLGTVVEDAKQTVEVNGERYLPCGPMWPLPAAVRRTRWAIWSTGAAPATPPIPWSPPAATCPSWSATTSATWGRSARMRSGCQGCLWT